MMEEWFRFSFRWLCVVVIIVTVGVSYATYDYTTNRYTNSKVSVYYSKMPELKIALSKMSEDGLDVDITDISGGGGNAFKDNPYFIKGVVSKNKDTKDIEVVLTPQGELIYTDPPLSNLSDYIKDEPVDNVSKFHRK